MYLKKNIEEPIEVSSEAAENILSILRFDKENEAMSRLHVYSDQFVDFLSKAMSAVLGHQTIVLTKNEASEIIIEFMYEIALTFNKSKIADIRGSANSRYAALLGEEGLIPRMVAMGIISKSISDVIYNYNANDSVTAVLMLNGVLMLNRLTAGMPGVTIRHSFVRNYGMYHAHVISMKEQEHRAIKAAMKKQKVDDDVDGKEAESESKSVGTVGVKGKAHTSESKVVVKKVISIQRGIISLDSDQSDSDWDEDDDDRNDPDPANTDLMHDPDDDEDDDDYVPNTGYNQDVYDPVGDTHLCVTRNTVDSLWFDVTKISVPRHAAWQEVLAQTFTRALTEGNAPNDRLFLDAHGHLCWRSDKPVWEIEGIDPMVYCKKLNYEAGVDYRNILHSAQNPDVIVLDRMDAIAMKSIFDQILEMNCVVDDTELWGNRALATERLDDVLTGYIYDFDEHAADECEDDE